MIDISTHEETQRELSRQVKRDAMERQCAAAWRTLAGPGAQAFLERLFRHTRRRQLHISLDSQVDRPGGRLRFDDASPASTSPTVRLAVVDLSFGHVQLMFFRGNDRCIAHRTVAWPIAVPLAPAAPASFQRQAVPA